MSDQLTPAARRVLDAAMRLFSDQGYAKTTIADIEEAAGLTVGTGGIYRHFRSKRELLETGVRRLVGSDEAVQATPMLPDLSLREQLTLYVRVGLVMIRAERALIRLVYRELDEVPDLLAEVKERFIHTATLELATRLREIATANGLDSTRDFEALAMFYAGGIINVGVVEAMLDVPTPVDDERLVAAFVDSLATYLESEATP